MDPGSSRVGPPIAGAVKVQFLVDPGKVAVVSDVAKEIQFYLIDKTEDNRIANARGSIQSLVTEKIVVGKYMEKKIMGDIAERLRHYKTKCSQNLNRVRLSHLLALRALHDKQLFSDELYKQIISASFADIEQDKNLARMCGVLNKLHLLALKINFELFLNRLLSTVWSFHFTELAPTISGHVDLSELAASIVENRESSPDLREFIIGKVVWNHGLAHFEGVLKRATQIQLYDVLNAKDFRCWPQIYTAFEARNLVEHRDGKVDGRFREAVARFWPNSSWGRRLSLDGLEKVVVEEGDVIATYDAMLNATELLTNELLRWSSRKAETVHRFGGMNRLADTD